MNPVSGRTKVDDPVLSPPPLAFSALADLPPEAGPPPGLLTVGEAARFLRRSPRWVYLNARTGAIPTVRLPGRGGLRLPQAAELVAWTEAGCPPAEDWRRLKGNRRFRLDKPRGTR